MGNEKWKELENYDGYEVSNHGRIRSYRKPGFGMGMKREKGKVLAGGYDSNGYHIIVLSVNGKRKTRTIHRLVAEAFIPNPQDKPEVNHKDGDKKNNHVSNLEWVTKTQNSKHSYKIGSSNKKGEAHHMNKLIEDDIYDIRELLSDGKLTQREIADIYNVDQSVISDIKNKKLWSHI